MSLGVVVGRFQVPTLHDGHSLLIDHVASKHDELLIVLGVSPLLNTRRDPLDYEQRRQMLETAYPNAYIEPIMDRLSDKVWSEKLDEIVGKYAVIDEPVVVYGGRDNCLRDYEGPHATALGPTEREASGTEVRKLVYGTTRDTADFRAGVIWASNQKFPTVYTTVDVGAVSEDSEGNYLLLLGRKAEEPLWRLPGGFADPGSATFEDDARRELMEETNTAVDPLTYLSSHLIPDWRYAKSQDCIKTLLYVGWVENFLTTAAGDDLAEVRYFDTETLDEPGILELTVMPLHQPLVQEVIDYINHRRFV